MDSTSNEEMVSEMLPLEAGPAGYTENVDDAVVVRSGSEIRRSQLTCTRVQAQLAEIVLSRSFNEELCKHISDEEFPSFNESEVLKCLQPLLSRRTKRQTLEGGKCSRKVPSSRGNPAEGLSDEVVELILSRIPFPALFKARFLSRTWFSKLEAQTVRSLHSSFQDQISSVSSRWTTYSPVLFHGQQRTFRGFDPTSHTWKSLAPLSYLPAEDDGGGECHFCKISTAGPLICFFHRFHRPQEDNGFLVTNVITKRWRQLPNPNPVWKFHRTPSYMRLLLVGLDDYKIILVYYESTETHVYNSCLQTWTTRIFDLSPEKFFDSSAYLDKRLYLLYAAGDEVLELGLLTYDMELDTWSEAISLCPLSWTSDSDSAIFVFNGNVMVTIWSQSFEVAVELRAPTIQRLHDSIGVFQLDLSTWQLAEVSRGPPKSIVLSSSDLYSECVHEMRECQLNFISNADSIYFGPGCGDQLLFPVLTYNLQTRRWSCLPEPPSLDDYVMSDYVSGRKWVGLAFQPGLNPFRAV